MDTHVIGAIRSQLASDISLVPINGHLRIGTPLVFDDGDHCSVFLTKDNGHWILTDLGDVLARAGYVDTDLLESGYRDRFGRLLSFFRMREQTGHIVMPIENEHFAEAIFTFAQGAIELVRLANAPPEKERKSEKPFQEAVSRLVRELIPCDRVEAKWHDPDRDPESVYRIDYRVRGASDAWYVFGVSTVPKCLHAAISCYHYKVGGTLFRGLAIYRNKDSLGKRTTLPLDEVAETFSVDTEEDSLRDFIRSQVLAA